MIHAQGLTKSYDAPGGAFFALRDVDLEIAAGEFVAVVGKSGSGKSTLLNLIGGIDDPTSGRVLVAGKSIEGMGSRELAAWRGQTVGFVFQFFQLLPTLTAVENVMLPMDFRRALPARHRRDRGLALLERVGIRAQADKLPASLSGGEQQRVAIARALANDPAVVLADEPTGNLDSETAGSILEVFRGAASSGTTVIVATHERDIARLADRTVELADGRVLRMYAGPRSEEHEAAG